MTDKFIFMLKTYRNDLEFTDRLISSYHKHNLEGIPLYIVLPQLDIPLFQNFESVNVTLIPEESIPSRLAPPSLNPRDSGYINQQVLKLAFYRLGIADNYMCLDSDALFIRDFGVEDFFHPDGLPYQVLVEDKLLKCDPDYFKTHWESRGKNLDEIAKALGFEDSKTLKSCHGFQILQSKVLKRFEEDYLSASGFDLLDIITRYGYEFTWYNYFLQMTEPVIHEIEPLFHVVHSGKQLVKAQLYSETETELAKSFLGIVVNGNFQHFGRPASLRANRILNAAAYVPSRELLRILVRFGAAILLRLLFSPVAWARRRFLFRSR